ncbi:hypothetical protein [Paenibacillus bovis]|uniref:hypothetical protein n=1 Tax=Paenibacillus bovis TaxID=1616788 RepID=UPI0013149C9A|nr:hypothetical protein [Paenibacillus bovis]
MEPVKTETQLTYNVRGKEVTFLAQQLVCPVCESEIANDEEDNRILKTAQLQYRLQHGMTGEEIRQVRQQYTNGKQPMSRELFSQLINISKSALQKNEDEVNTPSKQLLRVYADLELQPELIVHYFKLQERHMSAKDVEKVRTFLNPYLQQAQSTEQLLSDHYAPFALTEQSGYTRLNVEKLKQMVLYFTRRGPVQHQLGIMLWLADMRYFSQETVGISGLPYTRTSVGPAPLDYRLLLAHLEHAGIIRIDETADHNGWSVQHVFPEGVYDKDLLAEDEWEVIRWVDEELLYTSYGELQNRLTQWVPAAWKHAPLLQPVSYKVAMELPAGLAAASTEGVSNHPSADHATKARSGNTAMTYYMNIQTGELRTQTEFTGNIDYSDWINIPFYDYVGLAKAEKEHGQPSADYMDLVRSVYRRSQEDGEE